MIIAGLTVASFLHHAADRRYRELEMTVVVRGEQWWWRVTHLQDGQSAFQTANEIHIPVGTRVRLVNRERGRRPLLLGPKPGRQAGSGTRRTNTLTIHADRPGVNGANALNLRSSAQPHGAVGHGRRDESFISSVVCEPTCWRLARSAGAGAQRLLSCESSAGGPPPRSPAGPPRRDVTGPADHACRKPRDWRGSIRPTRGYAGRVDRRPSNT